MDQGVQPIYPAISSVISQYGPCSHTSSDFFLILEHSYVLVSIPSKIALEQGFQFVWEVQEIVEKRKSETEKKKQSIEDHE